MKKNILFFSIAVAMAGLVSCTSNDDVVIEPPNNDNSNPYFMDVKSAIENSRAFLESTSENPTRSSAFSKVTSFETVYDSSLSTRSGNEATPKFYIVNYGDSEGFSILSADSRMLPVYAFSNEGSLSVNICRSNVDGIYVV